MGCLYNANDGSGCNMFDENIEMNGCDEEGNCICDCDPDPSVMCDSYESDYTCPDCGCDLNVDECDCEDNY